MTPARDGLGKAQRDGAPGAEHGSLAEHRDRYRERCRIAEVPPIDAAFLFSYRPLHDRPCDPSRVTHRYARMCAELGIDSHLHALRHYSATEQFLRWRRPAHGRGPPRPWRRRRDDAAGLRGVGRRVRSAGGGDARQPYAPARPDKLNDEEPRGSAPHPGPSSGGGVVSTVARSPGGMPHRHRGRQAEVRAWQPRRRRGLAAHARPTVETT